MKIKQENAFSNNDSTDLDDDFTLDEVEKIVSHAKSGKASGIDGLVVDTMKNQPSICILTALSNLCLRYQLLLCVWALDNPRVPLNYRGIGLLPVTSKLYTAAISHRISEYLEKNDPLCNEQNRFRSKRSCLDHIFTLHDTCKVRIASDNKHL